LIRIRRTANTDHSCIKVFICVYQVNNKTT